MFKNILVPSDGSDFSNKAVSVAAGLAHSLQATLLVLHVRSPIDSPHHTEGGALTQLGEKIIKHETEEEERKLLDAALKLAAANATIAEAAFVAGYSPYEAIIRIAEEHRCDLIVMASHGRRGLAGLLIGSETQKVLTHTAIPVLVVR